MQLLRSKEETKVRHGGAPAREAEEQRIQVQSHLQLGRNFRQA